MIGMPRIRRDKEYIDTSLQGRQNVSNKAQREIGEDWIETCLQGKIPTTLQANVQIVNILN